MQNKSNMITVSEFMWCARNGCPLHHQHMPFAPLVLAMLTVLERIAPELNQLLFHFNTMDVCMVNTVLYGCLTSDKNIICIQEY